MDCPMNCRFPTHDVIRPARDHNFTPPFEFTFRIIHLISSSELRAVRIRESELELPAEKMRTDVLCPNLAKKTARPALRDNVPFHPGPNRPFGDQNSQIPRPFQHFDRQPSAISMFSMQPLKKPRHFNKFAVKFALTSDCRRQLSKWTFDPPQVNSGK